jgi:tRNA dimethylallyltransferase
VEQGFVDEVRALYQRGDLNLNMPSMRAVGYRQVWDYLAGELSYEEMLERGVISTRQLAKRQLTWLRNWPDLHWIHTDEQNRVVAADNKEASGTIFNLAKEYLANIPA